MNDASPSAPAGPEVPRLLPAFGAVAAFWMLSVGLELLASQAWAASSLATWPGRGAAILLAGAALALGWAFRLSAMRMLTSISFSAATIAAVLACAVLGTVIVQQAGPEVYAQRHGQAVSAIILALGLDDLFHTGWFAALLGLIGLSLVLTVCAKRAWRPPWWGHLLAHLGFVVVLIGGLIGSRLGFQGLIDLHEGQVASSVRLETRDGAARRRELGFAVRLHRFVLETYPPEARVHVHERVGGTLRTLRSFSLEEAAGGRAVGGSGARFTLTAFHPDFVLEPRVQPRPAGEGVQVLQLEVRRDGATRRLALQAGVAGRDSAQLAEEGPLLRLVATAPDATELARFATGVAERLVLVADGGEIEVRVGGAYAIGGGAWEVQVLDYLPDPVYDPVAKRPVARSQAPVNPALRIMMRSLASGAETPRWLYDRMPNSGRDGSGTLPHVVFRHQPARPPPARILVVAGDSGEMWRLDHGRVSDRLPRARWDEAWDGLGVSGARLHASAAVDWVPGSRSQALNHPVADLVIEERGRRSEHRLAARDRQPVELGDGRTLLSLAVRRDVPRTFQSHLAILVDGREVAAKTVMVNDPLAHAGHMLYQSGFRAEDPTYSGIRVVYDPGLRVVFAGLAMMALGVVFIYAVRPRLLAREAHAD